MKENKKFRIQISKNQEEVCGTYLQDSGLRLGLLTPDGNSDKWQRFLRNLKDGDLLEITKLRKKHEAQDP